MYTATIAMIGRGTRTQELRTSNPLIPDSCFPSPACSDWSEWDTFIQAAHAVTTRIDRHVLVSQRTQLVHQPIVKLGLQRTRELIASDLEPGERLCAAGRGFELVVPDATHAKAERSHERFGSFDDPKFLSGDFGVVRDPRRQTCRSRFIPRWKPGA